VNRSSNRKFCLCLIALLALVIEASASSAISGSYEIVSKSHSTAGASVVLRFHLVNAGAKPVYVDRIFLWDVGRPVKSAASEVITLAPATSEATTREFAIPIEQFEKWQRGPSPQVVLNLRTAAGTKFAQTIRLQRASGGKGR
jgi:hypothetical protein